MLRSARPTASLLVVAILWAFSVQAPAAPRRATLPEPATADDAIVAARQANAQNSLERLEAAAPRAAGHPLADYVDYWRLRMRLAGLRGEALMVPINAPPPSAAATSAAPAPAENTSDAAAAPAGTTDAGTTPPLLSPPPAAIASGSGQAAVPAVPAPTSAAVGALDADVQRFIATRPDTLVADLLRRDWLLNLGRRGDWARFDSQYPQWLLRDEPQVHCYGMLSRLQRGENVQSPARELLLQTKDLGEGCGALLEALLRSGQFKRDDVFRQMLYGLETQSPGTIRRSGLLLGMDPAELEAALGRGGRGAQRRTDRGGSLVAIVRTARDDPAGAAAMIEGSGLGAAEQSFAWSQVAAQGMRRLDPQSLDWTRRGLQAPAGDETWVWLARAALRAQDWKTLQAVIARMSPEGQRDAAWVYWKARALQAEGRRPEAEALLRQISGQVSFYGHLAAEELGILVQAPPRAPGPSEAELAEPARNAGFARALKFYDIGLRFEGNREWNWQLRGMNDRQLLAAAEWACRRSVLDRCVNTADRTASEHDFALRYISPFREQLQPVAAEMGLDPAWVYGLIRQESRFIMDARSSVGAQGLMQIMPATARWIARKMGVAGFRVEQLHDLDTNLRFGTFYLKSVYDDLEGSTLLASAAYNAGPNRPRTWRTTLPAAVEGAVFAEIIPFHETRDYVKKVLANTTMYSAMFTGQPQSLKQRLGRVAPRVSAPSELP